VLATFANIFEKGERDGAQATDDRRDAGV
jgi:hypothetical protein